MGLSVGQTRVAHFGLSKGPLSGKQIDLDSIMNLGRNRHLRELTMRSRSLTTSQHGKPDSSQVLQSTRIAGKKIRHG
jgi:hypothetical protein